jgi:hypothetical protein
MLVAELAEKLAQQYALPVLALIPALFRPTQSGTQIIADSCRLAILAVARHVQSRKVLQAIIEVNASKSSVQRQIVANSIFLIVMHWDREYLNESFQMLERVLLSLMSDPAPAARQYARDAFRRFAQIFPDKAEMLFAQLDSRTKTSFHSETDRPASAKPSTRAASVGSAVRRQKIAKTPAFSETTIRDDQIVAHAPEIARNLVSAMQSANPSILIRAFEITADVIHLITPAFRPHLDSLFTALFQPARPTQRTSVARPFTGIFPGL